MLIIPPWGIISSLWFEGFSSTEPSSSDKYDFIIDFLFAMYDLIAIDGPSLIFKLTNYFPFGFCGFWSSLKKLSSMILEFFVFVRLCINFESFIPWLSLDVNPRTCGDLATAIVKFKS